MLRVFCVLLNAAIGVGQAVAFLPDWSAARQAAARLFAMVDMRSAIDPCSSAGAQPAAPRGAVSVRDVHFAYPTRPDAPVLRGLSLELAAGASVALVGASGAGKSTVVSLLERFYDPDRGEVLLDGTPLRALNVRWLRRQIGLVMQEPVLFHASIAQNIACGRPGATALEVERAARLADAHDFIGALADGYATVAGEAGVELSGGQKQRVAIARALVREPRLLVLDEATSALDAQSEQLVQEALEQLLRARRCTVLLVAHRLSNVRGCDAIAVVEAGRIVEQGTHAELLAAHGPYAHMSHMHLRGQHAGASLGLASKNGHGDGGGGSTAAGNADRDCVAPPDLIQMG